MSGLRSPLDSAISSAITHTGLLRPRCGKLTCMGTSSVYAVKQTHTLNVTGLD
jgi:hypothetical protein